MDSRKNQKVFVKHILISSRPIELRPRIDSDYAFSGNELKKEFLEYFKHTERLSVFFQLIEADVQLNSFGQLAAL